MRQVLDLSQRADRLPAPPLPACRRLRHDADRLDEMVPIMNAAMEDRTTVEWDKDDLDALAHAEGRRARARHAHLHPPRLRLHAEALWRRADARHDPGRGSRRLPHAPPRRFARRLPGREPRPDVDAAAPQAAEFLRPRHRGGDRPSRPDPGRHGPSLSPPPPGHREGRLSPRRRPSTGPPTNSTACSAEPSASRSSRSRR